MEVSEYLVGSPAFKAGDTGDPRMAGSIPVHLRHSRRKISPQGESRERFRSNRLRSFELLLFILAIVFVLLFTSAGSLGAQARLLSSFPEDGQSLSTLELVRFEFDSLLLEAGAEITVTKLDGTGVSIEPVTVDGSTLSAEITEPVPSGNYSVGYEVQSSDGVTNEGAIRISVDSPDQALSGGLLAVVAIAVAMLSYLAFVFRADQRRRKRR